MQSSVAEAFTNDIALLTSLHIEQDVRQLIETQRLTDAFKLVVHKLNILDKTLVVLDNANNPEDLIVHKNLFDTAKCHYLITSRTQPQEWTIVEIDHLPPDEAVKLFQNLAPSVSASVEDLKSLLSKLFYHTLLIELVAKAVENAGFSFEELQTMIETKFIHDEQLNEDIVSTGKHGDSVAENRKRAKIEEYIWLIFSNVKDLSDDAKQILRGMALLKAVTIIDREFFKEDFTLFGVKNIVPNLTLLTELGWLEKKQREDNKPHYNMHPLIVDVIEKHLEVYSRLKSFLFENNINNPIKQMELLNYLQNINIKRIRFKNDWAIQECWELYQFGINQSLFIASGYFPTSIFSSIVNVGVYLKLYDWVKEFIVKWSPYIISKEKEEIYNLSLARICFEENKFQEVINLLGKKLTKSIPINLNARILLIRAYYEIKEPNTIIRTKLDKLYTSIYKSNFICGDLKTGVLNFIKIFKQLINGKSKKQLLKVLEKNKGTVICYEWLLEKVGEISE